ncbi:hypothetical protein F4805DRAFT_472947 [Annulohypoxylon moriforme]|nr:hypothetical protein F4805DRAFT_472947 [Annulohypoxylon moriforme]
MTALRVRPTRPTASNGVLGSGFSAADAEEEPEPPDPDNSGSQTLIPLNDDTGLDWDCVKILNQDPTEGDDFPARFDPPDPNPFIGDEEDKPDLSNAEADLTDFTAWALARVKTIHASKTVTSMINDPNLKVKWTFSVNTQKKDQMYRYREVKLIQYPATNYEDAYAAMVGIVLPLERACTNCKSSRGIFRHCIVLPGYFMGACVVCHYRNGGCRCSHRPEVNLMYKRVKMRKTEAPLLRAALLPAPPPPPMLPQPQSMRSILERDIQLVKQQHFSRAVNDIQVRLRIIADQVKELEGLF